MSSAGYSLVFGVYSGFGGVGLHIHLMQGIGILMMLLFFHLYFAPWRRFQTAVARQVWAAGGRQLGQIRKIVTINLVLGLVVERMVGLRKIMSRSARTPCPPRLRAPGCKWARSSHVDGAALPAEVLAQCTHQVGAAEAQRALALFLED